MHFRVRSAVFCVICRISASSVISNQREEIPAEERKIGSIVITADKGLAGAYNHNIVKLEEEILDEAGTA